MRMNKNPNHESVNGFSSCALFAHGQRAEDAMMNSGCGVLQHPEECVNQPLHRDGQPVDPPSGVDQQSIKDRLCGVTNRDLNCR